MLGSNRQPNLGIYETPVSLCRAIPLLAICSLLFFQGCVVGPDFTGIGAERIPTNYQSQGSETGMTASVEIDQWWQHFSDPALNRILEQAMGRNLNLQELLERVVESRANYRLQTGQLAPNVDLLAGFDYLKRSQNARPFVGANGDPFNLISLGLGATWEIDLFGRIQRTIEAADANIRQQELDAQNLRRILIGDIASSYVRVRLFQNQIQLALQNVEIQRRTKILIEERKQSGVSTDLDGIQAEALISRSQALVSSLRQLLQLELNNLASLMGEAPHDGLLMNLGEAAVPMPPPIPATGFPADLIRRRADVQREERAVAQATALIGVAEADLYPQLTLVGNVGVGSKSLSSLFQTDSLIFNVGPSLTWNILHFGRICANIEVHQSRARQAYLRYQQTALQAVREVEDTVTQHRGFQQQWIQFQKAVAADRQATELAFDRYKVGKINFQRVLDTQQQLLQDQQQMTLAQANAVDQIVRMYQALGGGWQSTDCDCGATNQIIEQPAVVVEHQPSIAPEYRGYQLHFDLPTPAESQWSGGQESFQVPPRDFSPLPQQSPTDQTTTDFVPSVGDQPSDSPANPSVSDMFDTMTLEWDADSGSR